MQVIIESSVAKAYAFSIFFWIVLDKCAWSMKILLLEPSYFRHSRNIKVAAWNCKSLITKTVDWNTSKVKALTPIQVKTNKKQCFQFFLDRTHTLILRARFFVSPIGWASNIACTKNQAPCIRLFIHSLSLFELIGFFYLNPNRLI